MNKQAKSPFKRAGQGGNRRFLINAAVLAAGCLLVILRNVPMNEETSPIRFDTRSRISAAALFQNEIVVAFSTEKCKKFINSY